LLPAVGGHIPRELWAGAMESEATATTLRLGTNTRCAARIWRSSF
jgi:hypothetical protein